MVPYVVPFSYHISYHFRTILSPDHTILVPFRTIVSPDRTVFVPFYPPDVPFSYHVSTESTLPPWMSVDDIMTIDDFGVGFDSIEMDRFNGLWILSMRRWMVLESDLRLRSYIKIDDWISGIWSLIIVVGLISRVC